MFRSPRVFGLLSLSVFVTGLVPLSAFAFTDVKTSTQYATAINALQGKGIVQGYANGSFQPTARINRAEFLKIVLRSITQDFEKNSEGVSCFPDVSAGDWFAPFVCAAKQNGIIAGYPDGLFHPERNINFAEAGKIVTLAYGQTVRESGAEWYAKYALALEASKAIPPSVAKPDSLLTRGEMAEIMWRLREGRTDQPSKGLLNLQNPALTINTASDVVQYPKTCADLQVFATAAQTSTGPDMMYMRGNMEMDGAAAPTTAESKSANQAGGDYSQTNVQVEGVDEADVVKTDGTFLYVLSTREKPLVRIVRATPASAMKLESTIDVGTGMSPTEMYVEDGKLILIGQKSWDYGQPVPMVRDTAKMIAPSIYPWPGYSARTDVRIYDVSNAASPKLERTVSIDGNSVSSRRIGSKLYLVLQQPFWYGGPHIMEGTAGSAAKAFVLPHVFDSKRGTEVDASPCNKVAILPHVPSPEYMTVAVVPTDDLSKDVKTTVVLGSAQNIYASLQNLYVATTQWDYTWDSARSESREKTRVYRFAFTDAGVELTAQGDAPGRILNQFSMDEHENHFRVATTVGQSWESDKPSSNSLYALNMNMERVGAVEDIAPGETIYSVRFAGDRAYMVTFKTVDPFFVIDVSNPRSPKVLGALKIPGFSNYLHPYDATHVIGFGKDVDESIDADKVHSTDAIYYTAVQGLKLALFDVTDVANPKQMFVEVIGDRGTDSPLLNNHKALLFDKERDLLAFPILVTKRPAGTDKSADGNPVFQGAYVYDVNLQKGFDLRGTVTHYDSNEEFLKAGSYWYGGLNDIQRIVRIGKQLLTVSDAQVRSHSETDVKQEGKVDLK